MVDEYKDMSRPVLTCVYGSDSSMVDEYEKEKTTDQSNHSVQIPLWSMNTA